MEGNVGNNKRIAKNTLFLYFRQLFTLVISLYTVRVLLKALGADDYGIFNVVGGVVTMFAFLSSTMATSTQRFLSFELGKKEDSQLNKIFSISVNIYIFIAIIVFLLLETVGLWFLNAKMVFPPDRLMAANIVYQSSVLSFLLTILCTPYNASIISNEDMDVFAYLGIAETVFRLAVVLALDYLPFNDNLIAYAILVFVVFLFVKLYAFYYCKKHYSFCYYKKYLDRSIFKSMLSFAGWNIIGSVSNVLRSQGINVLLNLFFGPVVNAARGIAYQINNAITSFSDNFYAAVRPQITKDFAANQSGEMESLITISSRFSFYLMLLLMIPISINAEVILRIWLTEVPDYTNIFLQLALLNALIEVYSMPLVTGIQATGNIRTYQLVVSILYLLNLPISYVLLKLGYPPQTTVIVSIILVLIAIFPRIYLAYRSYHLDVKNYITSVLLRTLSIGFICYISCYYINRCVPFSEDIVGLLLSSILMCVFTGVVVFTVGISREERNRTLKFVTKIIKKS